MKFVPNAASARVARTVLIASKHSPRMLFVAGVVGVGATVVLACRATLKLEDTLDNAQRELQVASQSENSGAATKHVRITTAVSLCKLYAPAVIIGGLSIAALTGSHHILTTRNTALTAAYATLSETLHNYRDRVRAEVGEEVEADLYDAVQVCEMEDPNDKRKKITGKVAGQGSAYARFFDENNKHYRVESSFNDIYLRQVQSYFDQRLHAYGHVFLNEVYDELGFERTPAGAVVGWVIGPKGKDKYIDFGIMDTENPAVIDFITGVEKGIWLNFNVDGVVYDLIGQA